MNTKILAAVLSAALTTVVAARPQSPEPTTSSNGVVVPSVPAPAANVAPAPVASAPAETNGVTQIVYSPTLPAVAELKTAAEAQGLKLERVVQTQIQVIAFYRNTQGQEITVAYQTTPPTGIPAPAPTVTAQPAVVAAPPPQVIYQTAPQVIYSDSPYYYGYPRAYYPPVSLSLGFVFGSGYHGGYYRGGYYGGYHGHWH